MKLFVLLINSHILELLGIGVGILFLIVTLIIPQKNIWKTTIGYSILFFASSIITLYHKGIGLMGILGISLGLGISFLARITKTKL